MLAPYGPTVRMDPARGVLLALLGTAGRKTGSSKETVMGKFAKLLTGAVGGFWLGYLLGGAMTIQTDTTSFSIQYLLALVGALVGFGAVRIFVKG